MSCDMFSMCSFSVIVTGHLYRFEASAFGCRMVTNSQFQRTVIWKVVRNMLPGKKKDQNSGESAPSGIMWSFAAGSNLATSTLSAEKESRKNLNKFYKELRTLKTVNMAGNSRELKLNTLIGNVGLKLQHIWSNNYISLS